MLSSAVERKLRRLRAKATADGHFALAAALALELDEPGIDSEINVVGALHEVGKLRNSLRPFWEMWRDRDSAWPRRTLERIATKDNDNDYWAVAALLGMDAQLATSLAEAVGSIGVRCGPSIESINLRYTSRATPWS